MDEFNSFSVIYCIQLQKYVNILGNVLIWLQGYYSYHYMSITCTGNQTQLSSMNNFLAPQKKLFFFFSYFMTAWFSSALSSAEITWLPHNADSLRGGKGMCVRCYFSAAELCAKCYENSSKKQMQTGNVHVIPEVLNSTSSSWFKLINVRSRISYSYCTQVWA